MAGSSCPGPKQLPTALVYGCGCIGAPGTPTIYRHLNWAADGDVLPDHGYAWASANSSDVVPLPETYRAILQNCGRLVVRQGGPRACERGSAGTRGRARSPDDRPAVAFVDQTKALLRHSGAMLEATTRLLAFSLLQSAPGSDVSLLDEPGWLELTAQIWGLFDPNMGIPLATMNLGFSALQYRQAAVLTNEMRQALSKNWQAEEHLRGIIKRWDDDIFDARLSIKAYRKINAQAADCRAD